MVELQKIYCTSVAQHLLKFFKYKSVMQVPSIKKIILNTSVGSDCTEKNILENARMDLQVISGQKTTVTKVRKSIAGFKIRQHTPIGCKVTLRKKRMWGFLERLINIAIPRIRDFRGFNISSFDGQGNYNIGIKEQIIFPEINYEKLDHIRGLDISIHTTALTDQEGRALLECLNFPFKK